MKAAIGIRSHGKTTNPFGLVHSWSAISLVSSLAIVLFGQPFSFAGNTLPTKGKPLQGTVSNANLVGCEQSVNVLLKSGIEKYQAGDELGAENIFKQVIAKDRQNANAYFNLGVICEHRGDLQSALNYYELGSKANPNDQQMAQARSQLLGQLAGMGGSPLSERTAQSAQINNQLSADEMPPKAPSIASQLARNRFAANLPVRTQTVHALANNNHAQASINQDPGIGTGTGKALLRTAVGVAARSFHVDTCGLCGLLHRW
jgi:tetratricopeptide (TPR) repeat protein